MMRTTLLSIAALAAGGLLLSRRREFDHGAVFEAPPSDGGELHMKVPVAAVFAVIGALAAGGLLVSRQLRKGPAEAYTVEESIELDVPVNTAYNQWTQFEEFPKFMASVHSVQQLDDTHLRWRAVVGGKVKEWDAEITEQIPDERIAWRSITGAPNSGVVTFHKISDSRCRVMLQMDYRPETVAEKAADAAGAVKLTTKGNLKKFKQMLEARGHETGAWRGSVPQH